MEAFDFNQPLALYEQRAGELGLNLPRFNAPLYLWLGLARLGNQNPDGAWESLERAQAAVGTGDVPFLLRYPLLEARSRCVIARNDLAQARALAQELMHLSTRHHEPGYAARGYRLLAEVASLEGDHHTAADEIARCLAALEGCESWALEWQVHATAARVFAELGRHRESQESRELSHRAARHVAATLFDEPELQRTFLERVARELQPPA
jgi:hypothetical protein